VREGVKIRKDILGHFKEPERNSPTKYDMDVNNDDVIYTH
jgi:hypothetical protein